MRPGVVVLGLIGAGCGRIGFGDGGDGAHGGDGGADAFHKIDAPPAPDADTSHDAAMGSGGYTVVDGTAPYASPISSLPIPEFGPGADEGSHELALPFTFPFYRIGYDAVNVDVNGYVTFGVPPPTGAESYNNDCPLDTTPPDAAIAVFWDDLFCADQGDPLGSITYVASGAPPDRTMTIEWHNMDAWYQAGFNYFAQGIRATQMLVLHENGIIELHYGPRRAPVTPNKDCGADRHRGCSATVGLEAAGSTAFEPIQCGTAAGPGPGYRAIDEGRLITFTPN